MAGQDERPDGDSGQKVELSVTLIQVDAIVTDKDGRTVRDLGPEDFEIREDGDLRAISHFLFVSAPPSDSDGTGADAASNPVRYGAIRRSIAIVVDNLESIAAAERARDALRRYVDREMGPNDLVAIVQTGAGSGGIQQFTADRRQLHAAIERVRYVPRSRFVDECAVRVAREGSEDEIDVETFVNGDAAELEAAFGESAFARGTLGALAAVMRGLRDLPGRKSVVLLSDGIPCDLSNANARLRKSMLWLTELATRTSVAIYSIDLRGLDPSFDSGSTRSSRGGGSFGDPLLRRQDEFVRSQEVLAHLARNTGGLFIANSNDIAKGIRRAVEEQNGYYLISYEPDDDTFSPRGDPSYHTLSLRVKRPGMQVRSRPGFFGVVDRKRPSESLSREEQLSRTLLSPFLASEVGVQLTPLFVNDPIAGNVVRCLVHFDTNRLTFVDDPDGRRTARVDVAVVAVGPSGEILARQIETHTVRLTREQYERAVARGLDHMISVPIERSGGLQFRAAVRDEASRRIGSDTQFVEVPDLEKRELALSSIAVVGIKPAARDPGDLPGATGPAAALAGASVRRFEEGDEILYGFDIYNVRRNRARAVRLRMTARVFREGKLIHTTNVKQLEVGEQSDWSRIQIGRELRLGSKGTPGVYRLEVTITDMLSDEKATRTVDFRVEPGSVEVGK